MQLGLSRVPDLVVHADIFDIYEGMEACVHAEKQIYLIYEDMKICRYVCSACGYDMKIWCARPCRPCRGAGTLRGSHGPSCDLGTSFIGREELKKAIS